MLGVKTKYASTSLDFQKHVDPDYEHAVLAASKAELVEEVNFVIEDGKNRWLGLQEVCENLFLIKALLSKVEKTDSLYHSLRPVEECLTLALEEYSTSKAVKGRHGTRKLISSGRDLVLN